MNKITTGDANSDLGHTFEVTIGNAIIQCHTLADAIMVQFAEHALTTDLELPYDAQTLDRIAEVLIRYGQLIAANQLLRRAAE